MTEKMQELKTVAKTQHPQPHDWPKTWPSADADGNYQCRMCPYKSHKQSMFSRHMGSHTEDKLLTSESVSEERFNHHVIADGGDPGSTQKSCQTVESSMADLALRGVQFTMCTICHGLFSDADEFADHSKVCCGDVTTTSCKFIACPKDLYLCHVHRDVQADHTPNDRRPKANGITAPTSFKRGRAKKGAFSRAEPVPRRPGLRKGTSEALHEKIKTLQSLLGRRIKDVPQNGREGKFTEKPNQVKSVDAAKRQTSSEEQNDEIAQMAPDEGGMVKRISPERTDEKKTVLQNMDGAMNKAAKGNSANRSPENREALVGEAIKKLRSSLCPMKLQGEKEVRSTEGNTRETLEICKRSDVTRIQATAYTLTKGEGEIEVQSVDGEVATGVTSKGKSMGNTGPTRTSETGAHIEGSSSRKDLVTAIGQPGTVLKQVLTTQQGKTLSEPVASCNDRQEAAREVENSEYGVKQSEDSCSTAADEDDDDDDFDDDDDDDEIRREPEQTQSQECEVRTSRRLQLKNANKAKQSDSKDWPKADSNGIYHCHICPYKSSKQGMFRRHMGSHNDGKMYTCEMCSAQFVYRRLYRQHLGTHSGFQCEHCGKTFSRRHDRSRHIETTHSNKKRYTCRVCGYQCRHHHMLTDHERKHTDERYICSEEGCQFMTIYRRALLHHRNTVHNTEKHIVCDTCGYKTNDQFAFSKHQKIHSAAKIYKCSLCDYTAHTASYVTMHMATHRQEKIYHCDQCDYASVRRTGIRSHMMKHIGVKPWQCPKCEYCSMTRTKIQRHIAMRHKGYGEPIRRNISIKFDLNAFRIDREQGPVEKDDEKVLFGSSEGDADQRHKYLVIEMVDDAGGTALSSNLVGQEVVVREETLEEGMTAVSEEHDHLEAVTDKTVIQEVEQNRGDEQGEPCLYKCALCDFTNETLEEVQQHMACTHSALLEEATTNEEVSGSEGLVNGDKENVVLEDVAVGVATNEGSTVIENGVDVDAEGTVTFLYTDADCVGMETTMEVEASPQLLGSALRLQDDAVSTAVESILHLQHGRAVGGKW